MIEVCDNNIWYVKKRRPKKIKRAFAFFALFIVIFGLFLYYRYVVTEQILRLCKDYSDKIATVSINDAVMDTLKDQIKYADLVTIEKNSSGDVSLMSVNSYKVNYVNREITEKTLSNIESSLSEGVPVPILLFSGINLLSGYGPNVKFKAVFLSGVKSNFTSEFKSVGINQTLHSVYIDVSVEVILEMPANRKKEICNGTVLVCETVIVGKVPDTYLNGKIFG